MECNCMKCIVDEFKTSLCEDGYCERFYGKTGNFIDLIPRWIPCGERLPETPIRVQVQLDNGWIITAYYDDGEWYDVPGDGEPIDGVLAWMPLPEPYKGAEQNGLLN